MLYPSSIDLVQTFDLVGDHQNRPLAIRSKLIPNDLEISERCDFRFHYLFAHNNSALSAIHSVAEGVVRPSASDPRDSTWIPANSFYARGQQINGPHMTDSEIFRTHSHFADSSEVRWGGHYSPSDNCWYIG